MSLARAIFTSLLLLLGLAQSGRAQGAPAAADATCHFLIAIETSAAMGKRAEAMRKTVSDLIATGIYGHMKPGQKLALWTFEERVYQNRFAMISWEPGLNRSLALNTVNALKRHPFTRTAQLDTLMREVQKFARSQGVLNVIVVSDGGEIMYGTPFDRRINLFFGKNYESFRKSGVPFVTTLVLKNGEFEAWSINAGDDKVFIPPLDEPLKMAKEAPTAPPRPGANLEIVSPPPAAVTNAPLPPIVITYAPNQPPKIETAPVAEAPKPSPSPTAPPALAAVKITAAEMKKTEPEKTVTVPPPTPKPASPPPASAPPVPITVTTPAPPPITTAAAKPETVTSAQVNPKELAPTPAAPIALPSATITTTSATPPAIPAAPPEAAPELLKPVSNSKTETAGTMALTPPPSATLPVLPATSISTTTKTAPTVVIEKAPAPKKEVAAAPTKSTPPPTPVPVRTPVEAKAPEKPLVAATVSKTNAPAQSTLPAPQTAVVLTPPADTTRWSFLGAGLGLLVIAGGLVYFMMRTRPVKTKPSLITKFVDNDKK